MKNNKNAVIFIYILFLVSLGIIFATVILSNNIFLFNINETNEIESSLLSNINNDSGRSINIDKIMNSNGSGFIDSIKCPSSSVTMSGTIHKSTIGTTLTGSGSIYCKGTYFGSDLKIYFNTGYTDLIRAEYLGLLVSLSGGLGLSNFGDSDHTLINFSAYNYHVSDGYDDNMNSDDFLAISTGSTYYPNNYQDDDNLARRMFYGFVSPDSGYRKVFWNTKKLSTVISDNTNNIDNLNLKIGTVTSGYLFFDLNGNSDIKLIKIDKNKYESTNELHIQETLTGTLLTSSGYLQSNSGVLSLSGAISGKEYNFDFVNNNYAIFLKSTGTGTITYNIKGFTDTGTGIYINPIDDSNSNYFRYLGNDILIDKEGIYIGKETELFFKK